MQLLTAASTTLSELLVSAPQLQAPTQRPKLKMVWHKEWDGKRERLVAQWAIDS